MVQRKTSEGFAKTTGKILKYVVMFIVVYYCAITAFNFGQAVFSDQGVSEAPGIDMTIQVDEQVSVKKLAKTLEEYGIIKDKDVLWIQSYIYDVKTVEPGTYTFNTSADGEEILKVIAAGPQEETQGENTGE